MYKIIISYQTGDSFQSSDEKEPLDLEWSKEEVALRNLKALEQHDKMVSEINKTYGLTIEGQHNILSKYSNEPWFVGESKEFFRVKNGNWCCIDPSELEKISNIKGVELKEMYTDFTCHMIALETDNGNYMRHSAFWQGYFEEFYGADIVSDKYSFSKRGY